MTEKRFLANRNLVYKIPLLTRALGLKAKRATIDRISCIQPIVARLAFRPSARARKGILHTNRNYYIIVCSYLFKSNTRVKRSEV